MKRSEIIKAHGLYLCGLSIEKVAVRFGETRQRLHYYFKREGLKTRPQNSGVYLEYNGERYTKNKGGYYRKTVGSRELLHRQVWIDNNGQIEDDMQIHHKDHNKENNHLSNLEKISIAEHARLHGFRNNQHTKRHPDNYNYTHVLCNQCGKEWKRSDSGHVHNRKFCNLLCKGDFLRGKPKGVKINVLRVWRENELSN